MERVTRTRIENDARLIDVEQEHKAARDELLSRPEWAQAARFAAFGRVFGPERVFHNRKVYLSINPAQRTTSAAQAARQAREEAELLRSLTPAEVVTRIEQTRAAEAAHEARQAEQRRAVLHDRSQHRAAPNQATPERGRSL